MWQIDGGKDFVLIRGGLTDMERLWTEYGVKLSVRSSRAHSSSEVDEAVKRQIQGHRVHEIYRNQVRRQKTEKSGLHVLS